MGCHPELDPHCLFLSFTTDEAGQSVMFELSGPAEGYVSFALSLDKWMVSFNMTCTLSNNTDFKHLLNKKNIPCIIFESILIFLSGPKKYLQYVIVMER